MFDLFFIFTGFRSREGDVINVSIKENFPSDDPQFGASKAKVRSCPRYLA